MLSDYRIVVVGCARKFVKSQDCSRPPFQCKVVLYELPNSQLCGLYVTFKSEKP